MERVIMLSKSQLKILKHYKHMETNQSTTTLSQPLQQAFQRVNEALERKIKLLEARLTAQRSNAPDNYIETYY